MRPKEWRMLLPQQPWPRSRPLPGGIFTGGVLLRNRRCGDCSRPGRRAAKRRARQVRYLASVVANAS